MAKLRNNKQSTSEHINKATTSQFGSKCAEATTKPVDNATFRLKRCVVKIKRIKPAIQVATKVAIINTILTPHKQLCCKVRIQRLSNVHGTPTISNKSSLGATANVSDKNASLRRSKEIHPPQDKALLSPIARQLDVQLPATPDCDVMDFEPARNSTMCAPMTRNTFKQPAAKSGLKSIAEPTATVPAVPRTLRFFHRDAAPSRRPSSITHNVYEFLSQSQSSDMDSEQRPDPAANIIKKMINDGRAVMMTRLKKPGKFRAKAVKKKKPVRPAGKRKQCSLQSLAEDVLPPIAAEKETLPQIEREMSPIYELQDDSSDEAEQVEPMQVAVQQHRQTLAANPNHSKAEGTFSSLARSALINQTTSHHRQDISKRRDLLDMARKFVSTPVNRKSASAAGGGINISPIMAPASSRRTPSGAGGGSSPWRVSDEAPLPNTFVFGLNTSQLPSYSSDYIRRRHVYGPDSEADNAAEEPTLVEQHDTSARSLFLENDSNGENVTPVAKLITPKPKGNSTINDQENDDENVENFVHLPNPRRTLQHRSPLKDINILDVVVLPSWKKNGAQPPAKTPTKSTTIGRTSQTNDLFGFEEEFLNLSNDDDMLNNSSICSQQATSQNLFGFEEFLGTEETACQNRNANSKNVTLHEKLQRLKDLRPKDKELPQVSQRPMRYAFDDPTANEPQQRNLKDMLCSTMISTPPHTALAANETRNLFQDLDPETTFDEKQKRRTYVRERPKRKRKRVHVLFVDTDSSADEDDSEQNSLDNSKSPVKAQPKKRICSRQEAQWAAKLDQYTTSFNKECDEVNNYQLVIE